MQNASEEKILSSVLAIGSFVVTVFVLNGTNSDPVNVTKLLALGGVAFSAITVAISFRFHELKERNRSIIIAVVAFLIAMLSSMFFSKAPFNQNYFGSFGRNSGFLTYLLLVLILIAATTLREIKSQEKILKGLFAAGFLNIIYCGWVLLFGDFLAWNNPSNYLFGFFGNQDFLSAFLGMYISAAVAYGFDKKLPARLKIFFALTTPLALIEIVASKAIQGLVVTVGGLIIVLFFYIWTKFQKPILTAAYSLTVSAFGILAIFGALQKGPFGFIYKRSVSLRGSYWRAGINMGNSHPFSGVGLDTYGDWYRSARPPVALIDTPGVSVLSNASHNVVIDFYASGGFPLLLSYLSILVIGAISIIRVIKRTKVYEKNYVALVAVWLCYQTQSIISINQIGIAIWGWLLTGLLLSYQNSLNLHDEKSITGSLKKTKSKSNSNTKVISPTLLAGMGCVIGLIVACPPLNADAKWFAATKSRNLAKVEAALVPNLTNPADSYKYSQAVNIFQSSNLPELARKYVLISLKFNPNFFDAWKQLYLMPTSTQAEKNVAIANMRRLYPKNPDVTATQ